MERGELLGEARAMAPALEEIFFALHRWPELGGREERTAELIRRRLQALGLAVCPVAGTGTAALLQGGRPGRTAAFRADIDALPIQEETGRAYASEVPGVMHACGHDFHTAALLGAAELLARRRETLAGAVKFFFQPDEEGDGGAKQMVEAGGMADPPVGAGFACHVDSAIPTGTVALSPGPVCAASDPFTIVLRGRGTHGAKPHLGRDVIAAGSLLVMALQTVVSRRTMPGEPVVVTVGSFHGGTAGNVLPEEARLTGILRTPGGDARQRTREMVRQIAAGAADAMGVAAEVELVPSYPACANDPAMTALVRRAAVELLGEDRVLPVEGMSMGADDFGYFLEQAPGCYYRVGVGNGAQGWTAPNHSPRFVADPGALPIAAALHAQVALDFLEGGR